MTLTVLLIPFIAAFIGWITNVVAVRMMFYPLEFFGLRPIGWQGIIPANAEEMAAKSTELITTKLINLKMLFEHFDPKDFSGNLDAAMNEITEEVIHQTAVKFAPGDWEVLPEEMRDMVRQMVRTEVEEVTVKILGDMSDTIEDVIDLEDIVVAAVQRDKALLGEIFQTSGREEFSFIKRSGAYFGFVFGIVQLGAWILYPAWWVLPAFGFFVGYATNWLAIKLIFEPQHPKKVGPWTVQGLFHKRQNEVAKEFAAIVSNDVLSPDNMVRRMVEGKSGEHLFGIVERRISDLINKYRENPMAKAMVPADQWDAAKTELFTRVRDDLPKPGGFLHIFTARAIDVYNELFERMKELDSESFEGVLRPAFKKDEWKLIVAGAALGLGAGILQVVYLFGDMLLK